MEVILQKVKESEKGIVQNLAAFYTYDMSRYCGNLPGWETPDDGMFSCFDLSKYWKEPNRYPYFIKVDNELAGFVLIHKIGTTSDIDWTIGEFFVIAKFQGKGIGREVAWKLFMQFPGKWEVMQIPENTAAINFWEKIISEYTNDDYNKISKIVDEPKPHPMVVMTFVSTFDKRSLRKKYAFKPYTTLFSKLFLQEKARLLDALQKESLDIQHIGSTAVPGLGDKGIIDIALAIKKKDREKVFHKLISLGYIFRENASTKERSFFRIDLPDTQEGLRRYHLHVTFLESIEWKAFLAFRDYLRSNPKVVQEYADLKRKSADGVLYREKKSPFFQKILLKVLGHKIFFVIEASGAGKTTTLKYFKKSMPSNCLLIHFDSIDVPSFEKMKDEHGSIEEWQKTKTFKWVEKLIKEDLLRSHVIFDAQVRPSFISEACNAHGVEYDILLFDCCDDERKRRLTSRGHPELADKNMMNWAAFLRRECQRKHYKIIDNTHITLEGTFRLFSTWLNYQLSSI